MELGLDAADDLFTCYHSLALCQAGRCMNDRAREHVSFLRVSSGCTLAVHCSRRERVPDSNKIKIPWRSKKKVAGRSTKPLLSFFGRKGASVKTLFCFYADRTTFVVCI